MNLDLISFLKMDHQQNHTIVSWAFRQGLIKYFSDAKA